MYYNGEGIEKNYEKALKWFLYAAGQGNIGAQYNLGWMFDKGEGTKSNYRRAIKWYRLAAKNGNSTVSYTHLTLPTIYSV